MTPFVLAWSNLLQQRTRTLISVIGLAFAVLLIFMQQGFSSAVRRTATLLYDKLDFDLILISREYGNLAKPSNFSRRRLAQVRSVPGVERVVPLTSVLGLWTQPKGSNQSKGSVQPRWSILILATDPPDLKHLFSDPVGREIVHRQENLVWYSEQLARSGTVIIDETSRREYGDPETWMRHPTNHLNGREVEVVGTIKIGTGFAYSGLLIISEASLTKLMNWPEDRVSFGLVKLSSGVNKELIRREIESRLPPASLSDVEIQTREWLYEKEVNFWMTGTAVGQFFIVGVFIAVVVGGVFVYQMMAADIARRLPEYATIRALGYPSIFLTKIVYWQGFLLALLGFIPGFICSLLGYYITHSLANVPIEMDLGRVINVLVLCIFMCMGSALLAVRSVHTADPADLF